jgi:hypothetical protein
MDNISIPKNGIIDRDYSYTEKEDYIKNVLPYVRIGYAVSPYGNHMYGNFVILGWKVSIFRSARWV